MGKALKDVPSLSATPEGIVSVAIPDRGRGPAQELFYRENAPAEIEPVWPVDDSSEAAGVD
jgi:hypothetical protein